MVDLIYLSNNTLLKALVESVSCNVCGLRLCLRSSSYTSHNTDKIVGWFIFT